MGKRSKPRSILEDSKNIEIGELIDDHNGLEVSVKKKKFKQKNKEALLTNNNYDDAKDCKVKKKLKRKKNNGEKLAIIEQDGEKLAIIEQDTVEETDVQTKKLKRKNKKELINEHDDGVVTKVKKTKTINIKSVNFSDEVPASSGATKNVDTKKNKAFLNDDEAEVKDEDIDAFCDELDDEDNEHYQNWVKLIEANMHSKKAGK